MLISVALGLYYVFLANFINGPPFTYTYLFFLLLFTGSHILNLGWNFTFGER